VRKACGFPLNAPLTFQQGYALPFMTRSLINDLETIAGKPQAFRTSRAAQPQKHKLLIKMNLE
jgi:hypothetical protein